MNGNLWTSRILPALGLLIALAGLGVSVYLAVSQPGEPAAGAATNPATADAADKPAAGVVLTGADFPAAAAAVAPGHQVGYRIPDFALELADGGAVTAADLIAQSKPTFLFFWATT